MDAWAIKAGRSPLARVARLDPLSPTLVLSDGTARPIQLGTGDVTVA